MHEVYENKKNFLFQENISPHGPLTSLLGHATQHITFKAREKCFQWSLNLAACPTTADFHKNVANVSIQ